jgi:hypothetical protein
MGDDVDKDKLLRMLFNVAGGREKYLNAVQARYVAYGQLWNQDAGSLGRVLRAHLVIEHLITACLRATNRKLGPPEKARLTFAQKVELLDGEDTVFRLLRPGIIRLNVVRNRCAHASCGGHGYRRSCLFPSLRHARGLRKKANGNFDTGGYP